MFSSNDPFEEDFKTLKLELSKADTILNKNERTPLSGI